jgi:hypothetical protein
VARVWQLKGEILRLQLALEEVKEQEDYGDCCVCFGEEREAPGLRCHAATGFGHFLCAECLQASSELITLVRVMCPLHGGRRVCVQGHVKAEIDADRIMQTRGVIRCPHREGPDLRPCESEPWKVRVPRRK